MRRLSLAQSIEYLEGNDYVVLRHNNRYDLYGADGWGFMCNATGTELVKFAREHGAVAIDLEDIHFTNNGFGVEIECFHPTDRNIFTTIERALRNKGISAEEQVYNHRTQALWKITTDASISGGFGAEVVSPVLHGEEGLQELATVMETLEELGCRVNRSTGTHVHHDLTGYENRLQRLFLFYQKNERLFDSLQPQSRRGNRNTYCGTLQDRTFNTWRNGTRYVKLNPTSFVKYGTIEFRQHSGTLNPEKISHWIKLTQAVVEYCKSTREIKQFDSLEEMMDALNITDTEWYIERCLDLMAC